MEKQPEQNKTPYEAPEMKVISLENRDVITASDIYQRMEENDTQGIQFPM